MPDSKETIQRELANLDLSPDARKSVISELATHLEDCERHSVREPDLNARQWRRLSRAIQQSKMEDAMNRTKALSIPIFVNLLLSSVLINICDWLGWIDVRITQPGPLAQAFQPWLLTLPICGATAAFLARGSQASPAIRLLAAVSPSLVWLASIPVVKLIFVLFPGGFAAPPLSSLVLAVLGWFLLPAFALFVGAVPFLMPKRPQVSVSEQR
jgi:hypothetical protein